MNTIIATNIMIRTTIPAKMPFKSFFLESVGGCSCLEVSCVAPTNVFVSVEIIVPIETFVSVGVLLPVAVISRAEAPCVAGCPHFYKTLLLLLTVIRIFHKTCLSPFMCLNTYVHQYSENAFSQSITYIIRKSHIILI